MRRTWASVAAAGHGGWKLFVTVFVFLGCATTPALTYPPIPIVSRRVAALPSDVAAYQLDIDGHQIPIPDLVAGAKKNLDGAIEQRVTKHGGRSFRAPQLGQLENAGPVHLWAIDAMGQIMTERLGRQNTFKRHVTVGDWRFPHSLDSWRPILDADFVLVSMFMDGRNTAGRSVAVLFGGGVAARRAMVCVVHLGSGRIVWCNFEPRMNDHDDLMSPARTQSLIDSLLEPMLLAGDGVAPEPPPSKPPTSLTGEQREAPPDEASPHSGP